MRRALLSTSLLIAAGLRAGLPAPAPYHAELQASRAGTYEAVLPAGLHSQAPDGGLDLLLLGPDGQPRSFELYWARGGGERTSELAPESYRLQGGAFIWEAPLPKAGDLSWVEVEAGESGFSGKLRVELDGEQTRVLARDRALFSEQPARVELPHPLAGRRLRLVLSGMDERFRASAKLLGRVRVGQRAPGQEAATQDLALRPQSKAVPLNGVTLEELSAELPGSGLMLERLDLRTSQALIGRWALGRACLQEGRVAFCQQSEGSQDGLGRQPRALQVPVNARWNSRELRLRLDNQGRRTGVESLTAHLRLPRLAFDADKAGTYTLLAGSGASAALREHPADDGARPTAIAVGPVQRDAAWRPEAQLARFVLQGAALDAEGYAWSAPVPVPGAGYWMLSLPDKVVLEGHAEGLRLSDAESQVPFFVVEDAPRTLSLTVQRSLDAKANRSTWSFSLPQPSSAWRGVRLRAHGIFQRALKLEWRRPDAPVWQSLPGLDWANRGGDSVLELPLGDWARERSELRITVEHGDNKALELDGAEASFSADALAFVTDKAAGLTLWGGKDGAGPGRYDLELLRDELQGRVPSLLSPGAVQAAAPAPLLKRWTRFKAGSQLWFYLSLALVTVGLLAVIAKLLPRA